MPATVTVNGEQETYTCPAFESSPPPEIAPPTSTLLKGSNTAKVNDLAFTRSGDKVSFLFSLMQISMMTQGNSCNIGVIARNPAFLPYLRDQLTEEVVAEQFKHCFEVLIVFSSHWMSSLFLPDKLLKGTAGGSPV